jgi:hypothetical protein
LKVVGCLAQPAKRKQARGSMTRRGNAGQKRVAIPQNMQHGTPVHQFNTIFALENNLQETFWFALRFHSIS